MFGEDGELEMSMKLGLKKPLAGDTLKERMANARRIAAANVLTYKTYSVQWKEGLDTPVGFIVTPKVEKETE